VYVVLSTASSRVTQIVIVMCYYGNTVTTIYEHKFWLEDVKNSDFDLL